MTSSLTALPKAQDLSALVCGLTTAIELLGWAGKTRTSGVTHWEVYNPNLLAGLREAAKRSLAIDGFSAPQDVISGAVEAYGGNEFLAYRSLLNEGALHALTAQFEKILKGGE